MILQTERLILRPWEEEDAENLYQYAKDPAVGPIAAWPVHTSVQMSKEVINTVFSAPETYAVCLKEDGKPIGCVGLNFGEKANFKIGETEGELGYWLGVPFWGRGIIPEACKELMCHAFEDLQLTRIWCACYDENTKSKRVQEKCGFCFHHTIENDCNPILNTKTSTQVSCITKQQWENSQK